MSAPEDQIRYGGEITRVRFDAYGPSAAQVSDTLVGFASQVDGLLAVPECSYGECVIERNLTEADGEDYSWKGRLTIHPCIGREPFVPVTKLIEGLPS